MWQDYKKRQGTNEHKIKKIKKMLVGTWELFHYNYCYNDQCHYN